MNKTVRSHVKIGDKIKIISGQQKGLLGVIIGMNLKKSLVFIDSVTPRIKFAKKRENEEIEKKDLQVPIHISNIMLWDKITNKSSRIGYKFIDQEKKRYFKKSGNLL